MRTLWPQLRQWVDAERPFALATVVATAGSAPRGPGAVMAIDPDPAMPRFLGSVSSGCLDSELVEAARTVIDHGGVRHLSFGPDGKPPWSDGLTCGGRVSVRLERWWGTMPVAKAVLEWLENDLVGAVLSRGEAHLAIASDALWGNAADWPKEWIAEARRRLTVGGPSMLLEGADGTAEPPVFLRLIERRPRLVLVGASDVALDLVALAQAADWRTIVLDPRRAYLDRERFKVAPDKLIKAWPEAALRELELDSRDAAVVLAHDPKIDDPALCALLASGVGSIGAMGSSRSHAKRLDRLREQGVAAEDLDRINGPAGIHLGAASALGIATGIFAGIVRWRAGRDG